MTQRIFDVNNEQDIRQLFEPLNEIVQKICYADGEVRFLDKNGNFISSTDLIDINCSNGTVITRPIQEATEEDIGKLCRFCNYEGASNYFGILCKLREMPAGKRFIAEGCNGEHPFVHAYRLTKQEIEELC